MYLQIEDSPQLAVKQLKDLNAAIVQALTNGTTIPWDVVDPSVFNTKHTAMEVTRTTYKNAKQNAPALIKEKALINAQFLSNSRKMAQYIKNTYPDNTKKLEEYGIRILHGKSGTVKLAGKLHKQVEMYATIIETHLANGANSILSGFDMAAFEALFEDYKLAIETASDESIKWRKAGPKMRENIKELVKMQRRIARQFLNVPGVSPRDLEDWGYVVIENHNYTTLNAAA